MNIFIIEDDLLKLKKIEDFLYSMLPDAILNNYGSFNSGLRACENSSPDLVILDMALPTFDRQPNKREGRLRPLGGYDLLRKFSLKELSTKAIVVTQLTEFGDGVEEMSFGEISQICLDEFPEIFLGSVYFGQASLEWQNKLQDLILKFQGELA
jgi:DNA-binding NarL/FixJ family response regulator